MNIKILLGAALIGYIFYSSIISSAPNPKIFLDTHALSLVFGGTLAVVIFSLSFKQMKTFAQLFVKGFLFKKNHHASEVVKDLVNCSIAYQNSGPDALLKGENYHPFIIEGCALVAEDMLSVDELAVVLNKRKDHYKKSYSEDAKILSSLAKYPPAFGLLGATSGMVTMMGNLGSGGKEQIGLGMATALVATLWGIALANFIILPFADYTERLSFEDNRLRDIIAEGMVMIAQKENVKVMTETLNSAIKHNDRVTLTLKKTKKDLKDAA